MNSTANYNQTIALDASTPAPTPAPTPVPTPAPVPLEPKRWFIVYEAMIHDYDFTLKLGNIEFYEGNCIMEGILFLLLLLLCAYVARNRLPDDFEHSCDNLFLFAPLFNLLKGIY